MRAPKLGKGGEERDGRCLERSRRQVNRAILPFPAMQIPALQKADGEGEKKIDTSLPSRGSREDAAGNLGVTAQSYACLLKK